MDEVFGPDNCVATIAWEKSDTVRNDARRFSGRHDHINVYARDARIWFTNRLPRSAEADAVYRNPDDDPRGPWLPGDPYANKPYSKRGDCGTSCKSRSRTSPLGVRLFARPAGAGIHLVAASARCRGCGSG
jgi:hypothetical protein